MKKGENRDSDVDPMADSCLHLCTWFGQLRDGKCDEVEGEGQSLDGNFEWMYPIAALSGTVCRQLIDMA